jgi:hypothetical protein
VFSEAESPSSVVNPRLAVDDRKAVYFLAVSS